MGQEPTNGTVSAYSVYFAIAAIAVIEGVALYTGQADKVGTIVEALLAFAGIRQGLKSIANR